MKTVSTPGGVRRRDAASPSLHRVGAVVLLFAALPFHWNFVWGPASVNMSYGDGVVAVVGLLWLAGVVASRKLPKYAIGVAAFVLVSVASFALAWLQRPEFFSTSDGVVELFKFLGGVAWMVAVFALLREHSRRLVPLAAGVSVLVATAFVAWSLLSVLRWGVVRPAGPFSNPNIYGNYLVFAVCLALLLGNSWVGEQRRTIRWLSGSAVGLLVIGVLATESRGALLGVGAVAATTAIWYAHRRDTAAVLRGAVVLGTAFLSLLTILALYGAAFIGHLWHRLSANVASRFEMWAVAADAFRSSPILGIGFGQIPPYLELRTGNHVVAHNVYVTIGAETGVVGLAMFVVLLIWVGWDGWTLSRRDPVLVFLVAFVAATAVQGIGTGVENFRTLWVTVGCVAAYEADVRDSDETVSGWLTTLSAAILGRSSGGRGS